MKEKAEMTREELIALGWMKKPSDKMQEKPKNQLTAVEWLCNEWLYLDQQFDMCLIDRNTYWDKLRQIQEQAKEMEKERIMNAYYKGGDDLTKMHFIESEQYYNETFKSE